MPFLPGRNCFDFSLTIPIYLVMCRQIQFPWVLRWHYFMELLARSDIRQCTAERNIFVSSFQNRCTLTCTNAGWGGHCYVCLSQGSRDSLCGLVQEMEILRRDTVYGCWDESGFYGHALDTALGKFWKEIPNCFMDDTNGRQWRAPGLCYSWLVVWWIRLERVEVCWQLRLPSE